MSNAFRNRYVINVFLVSNQFNTKITMWLSFRIVLKSVEMGKGFSMIAMMGIKLMEMGVIRTAKFKMDMFVKEVRV